jgi:hypothetical protein
MAAAVEECGSEADRQGQPERDQTEHQRGEHRVGGPDPSERQRPGESGLDETEPARGERQQPEERRSAEGQQHEGRVGLRADGVGTVLGGLFNTFPYTSFSQNVGLVSVTGVRSRWVTITGGAIMLVLGLLPKMAALVEAVERLSTPPIGRVTPGRDQQRHVEMAFGIAHRKAQRNAIEKRRI